MERYQYTKSELALIEESCIPFAVYQFIDKRVVTIALSAGFCELFALDDQKAAYELMDNDMYRDVHPDDVARISDAALDFATTGGDYNILYRSARNGEYRIIHAFGKHVFKENGVRLATIWYNDEGPYSEKEDTQCSELEHVLSRQIEENNMYKQANYDYLTGLPGMSYFFDLADIGRDALKDSGFEVAFLFINLSGMKSFNEKYGFAEGDKLIRAMSKVLIKHFGAENCSRFNADHFALFTKLQGLDAELLDIFNEARDINDGKNLPITVGIYPDNLSKVSVTTACDRAKMACDAQKHTFTSKFVYFDESMVHAIEKRQYIIQNLDKAMKEGWIELYFQPIVRTANGRVCDEEALARWNDPEKGFMKPIEFIPILEKENLIYKLDLYVVDKVLEKLKDQAERGYFVVPQSVNLSKSDFYSCDMVEEIRRRVDEAGVGRENITIEITESVIAEDIEFMKIQIERFQKLGFKVWMDDYGSGYASPTVLQKIHFDLIKVDMLFVKQIKEDDTGNGKVVLAELIKMIASLGIETVAEGVESMEQVDFLKEIGCTKLQGEYYCKAIPQAEIYERNRKGIQIGFENPAEADYYASVGSVNLYNMSISQNDEYLNNYFDTLPMVITEIGGEQLRIVRANKSFRDFIGRNLPDLDVKKDYDISELDRKGAGDSFFRAVKQCAKDGKRAILEERTPKGAILQLFVRRIAVNPVTGFSAVATVILSVNDKKTQDPSLTYTYVARALSEDYIDLYYVNMDTDKFIEYEANNAYGDLPMERYGDDFFATLRGEALVRVLEDDQDNFLASFTKENIKKHLESEGVYNISYRLKVYEEPTYVNMKIVPIKNMGNHIIIGINNIDAQMKQREALERIKEERITYARMTALAGNYLAIYTVNPENDTYSEYNTSDEYAELGIQKRGDRFFERAYDNAAEKIYFEDIDLLRTAFTKENILKSINETGMFTLNYRLMLKGMPNHVSLRAALVQEKDGPQLIIGVTDIEAQVRRDQEYTHNLNAARDKANLDELTGVRNKHAYADVEERFNDMIANGSVPEFAIVVCDLNGLKHVNDTYGHQAGDNFIKKGCDIICKTFKHSPVYRVGGDEFVAFVQGEDYENLEVLMQELSFTNRKNKMNNDVVVAVGFERYKNDRSVAAVFERADSMMYENKKLLKGIRA